MSMHGRNLCSWREGARQALRHEDIGFLWSREVFGRLGTAESPYCDARVLETEGFVSGHGFSRAEPVDLLGL